MGDAGNAAHSGRRNLFEGKVVAEVLSSDLGPFDNAKGCRE